MENSIRIAGIVKESIVDGPGIRLVVFAQGCNHHCPGCHNPQTHSFQEGTWMETDEILELIRRNPLLDGVTFSGGEPFEQSDAFASLAEQIKPLKLNVMTYTGYTYEELLDGCKGIPGWRRLLDATDLLVDGRFELARRNLLLKFRGSENQRIIDMRRTRETGRLIQAEI